MAALIYNTMIAFSDIKVGVITLDNSKCEFDAVQGLFLCGVARDNIEVKHVPSAAKAPLAALFFAEYTEVDCVYIAMPEGLEEVRERLAELELQCRMPIGTSLRGFDDIRDMLQMVRLQSQMVAKAEQEQRSVGNFKLN
jgi:6,7-dimethyl-8-ribityllumazine synthase